MHTVIVLLSFSHTDFQQPRKNCSKDEFLCDRELCINKNWVCDGQRDCEDSTDEFNCSKYTC